MIAAKRAFLESFIARLERAIEAHRTNPRPASANIIGALERIIAADRAELDAAGPEVAAPAPVVDADRITWKSPCFNAGGRFNPWAGTYAQAMLASADACDRLGHPEVGDDYRFRATEAESGFSPDISQVTAPVDQSVPRRPMKRAREIWTGPNLPPPEPTPFVSGEQMGFLL